METRKYQLQKQIVEALNTNNNELYDLLKTQWAHRFGVESLVELDDIDLRIRNEALIKGDIPKNDQVDDVFCKEDETSFDKENTDLIVRKEENLSKESVNNITESEEENRQASFDIAMDEKISRENLNIKTTESEEENRQASFDISMDEKVSRESLNIKITDTNIKTSGFENSNIPKVEPLIPLPPKARYSYLEKWLVRY